MRLEIIGKVHSCFSEKFGIPRQPGLAPHAVGRIELLAPYNREEMVRGLDGFSHVWILFLFHKAIGEGWKTTVRPPRLGGQNRIGIWGCRSPHRPNFLGMSVVRLKGISIEKQGLFLELAGIDMVDGTPVVDIKPYIPYSDLRPEAEVPDYFGNNRETERFVVELTPEVRQFCEDYQKATGNPLLELLHEVLGQDPRPASQKRKKNDFGMLLWEVNIRYRVEGYSALVYHCERL